MNNVDQHANDDHPRRYPHHDALVREWDVDGVLWRTVEFDHYFGETFKLAVSELGDVRQVDRTSIARGGELRTMAGDPCPQYENNRGYVDVRVLCGGRRRRVALHAVVAFAFYGPRPDGHDVDHLNGDKTDNRAANLDYCTRSENLRRYWAGVEGDDRNRAQKLTPAEARELKVHLDAGDVSQVELAERYGVSEQHVSNIKHGRRWGGARTSQQG